MIAWKPIKGLQSKCLTVNADHILACGPRGPGKTAVQLVRFAERVGRGYGTFWKGLIIDREFKNLADVVAQSKKLFAGPLGRGARWHSSVTAYRWVWPTGESLEFRHAKGSQDYDQFHGHEYPYIGFNELGKQPTRELYDLMMSVNRSSFVPELHTPADEQGNYLTHDGQPVPPIPLEMFSTSNPYGPGRVWMRRHFIDVAPYDQIYIRRMKVYDPKIGRDVEVKIRQVAIFGNFYENPYLSNLYRAQMLEMCRRDPNLYAAWIEGSFDHSSGGALDDLWRTEIHVLEPFNIPVNWKLDRTFDWGSTQPFSVCWWATSDGTDFKDGLGQQSWVPRGTTFMIHEWYGSEETGTNRGLKMSPGDIADGILIRENNLMQSGRIKRKPSPGPADNQIRQVSRVDVDTIEKVMADRRVYWQACDKSPGSRVIGLQLIRDRLENANRAEGRGLYFFRHCVAAIETLRGLPRDPVFQDDVDSNSEDHIYDATRYKILAADNRLIPSIKAQFAF